MNELAGISKEVKNGAALLDEERPDWFEEIVLDELEMNTCENCILGQIYGDYNNGIAILEEAHGTEMHGADYGFDRGWASSISYPILQEEWEIIINHKLSEGGTNDGNA